ncbi:MAG: 3-phosphoshikimate 1-carboxyvinyltransferase [Bacteroidota bacterium]
MIREIVPISSVNATVHVPGSKSITNRALICAALAQGESVIRNASDSDDTRLMTNGLNQLGVLVRLLNDALVVHGTGGKLHAPKFPIPVGNAGTTLRFMLSLAALAQGTTTFEADARMAERPLADLLDAMRTLGVEATVDERGPRYRVSGGGIVGGAVKLQADKSSQFLTSLLLAASYAQQDVRIDIVGVLSSVSYVDITLDVMKKFGVDVVCSPEKMFEVKSGQRYKPTEFAIESDASGASYFLAAAAIVGGSVTITNMKTKSLQGDVQFIDVLKKMGCTATETESGVGVQSTGRLNGIDIDMNSMPDIVPTLAVTALFAQTPTRIRNVAHLRYKESDRLTALATELKKLGAQIALHDDGLEISPAPLHGAQLDTYDDHRLAMSFALIGLRVPGVKIENPQCVKKSFPGFWREFEKL